MELYVKRAFLFFSLPKSRQLSIRFFLRYANHVPKSAAPASQHSARFLSRAGLFFDSSKFFHASISDCRLVSENVLGIRAKNNRPQKQPNGIA
jgi:hypothetical protein